MTSRPSKTILATATLMFLGACAQIVGIEDPRPIEEQSTGASSSGGSSSSGSTTSDSPGRWIAWPMPNGTEPGLPNQANYMIDATNDVVVDKVTGLMWQRTTNGQSYVWTEAMSYCENLVHGGYDDWRLPWRIELVSLIDFNQANPAMNTTAFPNAPSNSFWSASTDNKGVWFVYFGDGDTYSTLEDNTLDARCVR